MSEPLRHVAADALTKADPTPGMDRRLAYQSDRLWTGLVHTDAGVSSGWHHHGEYETCIYVVDGRLVLEFGPGGEQVIDAGPGDFVQVPPHTVHRERNPTGDTSTAVLVRSGEGPPTINVDGPEPA